MSNHCVWCKRGWVVGRVIMSYYQPVLLFLFVFVAGLQCCHVCGGGVSQGSGIRHDGVSYTHVQGACRQEQGWQYHLALCQLSPIARDTHTLVWKTAKTFSSTWLLLHRAKSDPPGSLILAEIKQTRRLNIMLLVANSIIQNNVKKAEKWLKPWQMGTHLRVFNESFPMNTKMIGFRWFSKIFEFLCLRQK